MSKSSKSIAAYVRVSTKGQKTESQEHEIRSWMKNNGYELRAVVAANVIRGATYGEQKL